MSAFLALRSIRKRFGTQEVLADVSVGVGEGEVLALLGPSGSGKTTLLRVVAGFETPDGGAVEVDGRDVVGQPPERRRFGMVFQHYALFPHLSVGENVAFGLESGASSKAEVAERIEAALAQVDLAGFAPRRIHEISGGQQQRVALARALAPGPRLLLLDEPLSNLDPTLRERTRSELRRVVGEIGITAIWVTHEQEEAFHVGDVVAVLDEGRLQQSGPPDAIYRRPANRFVAGFVGRASWLAGRRAEGDRVEIEVAGRRVTWPAMTPESAGARPTGGEVDVLLRPEQLALREATATDRSPDGLPGRLAERRFAGATTLYRVELAGGSEIGGPEIDGPEIGGPEIEVGDSDPGREVGARCSIDLRPGEVVVVYDREPRP